MTIEDGVPNTLDRCNDTPLGATVDLTGCTQVELEAVADYDKDFDGVPRHTRFVSRNSNRFISK